MFSWFSSKQDVDVSDLFKYYDFSTNKTITFAVGNFVKDKNNRVGYVLSLKELSDTYFKIGTENNLKIAYVFNGRICLEETDSRLWGKINVADIGEEMLSDFVNDNENIDFKVKQLVRPKKGVKLSYNNYFEGAYTRHEVELYSPMIIVGMKDNIVTIAAVSELANKKILEIEVDKCLLHSYEQN